MIRYITRKELNVEKYDDCIKLSLNSRVYAFSWYLDIVADNWDALVLNDYEAVMPLPWRQKFFIKYIYPPAWTQQLGVFSTNTISEKLIVEFIKSIPRKFKKITIQFNSENRFQHKGLTERINYILPLNRSYEEIYQSFNANRKRDLNKSKDNCIFNENVAAKAFISFLRTIKSGYSLNEFQIVTLSKLLNKDELKIYGIEVDKQLVSCIVWLKSTSRITYLFSATSVNGKELGAQTLLVSKTIKKFKKSNLIVDFEGSMIDGVARFYKSFGAIQEPYSMLKIDFSFFNKFST